jgi:hypothetical protein
MASWCPNCGREVEEDEQFCRQCGMPQELTGEEATTWLLSPENAPRRPGTSPVSPTNTGQAGAQTGPSYMPPPPPQPGYQSGSTFYAPPPSPVVYPPVRPTGSRISLGEWLTGGWQVYKENWVLMSLASLLGAVISVCTLGILTGPLLMGLFAMAFKTMRGEQPIMQDLFSWQGRFLQAFLVFLIFFVAHIGLAGLGNASSAFNLISLAVTPMLSVLLSFSISHILERRGDVVTSINDVVRLVFSREWFQWWLVGVVISAITAGGFVLCGGGILITLPWMICTAAVAYRDTFGFDDPNRTNQ